MGFRYTLLRLLPKVALSRAMGSIAPLPVPRCARGWVYGAFARRYGADLGEMAGQIGDYRSLAQFFQRPLRPGARPVAAGPLVWPCDGKVVTAGAVRGGRIPQVKGVDYSVAELLGDAMDPAPFLDGSQATVYLAPGDYHRVHSPFAGRVAGLHRLRGTLFPVNPQTVRAVPGVFVKNARVVFPFTLTDGRPAAVVMVGALNVGQILPSVGVGQTLSAGDELGRFGFGSTTVVLCPEGGPIWPEVPPQSRVRLGELPGP